MSHFSTDDVTDRLHHLRARIAGIERTWSHDVEVVAVTKGFSGLAVEAAASAGCRSIGENYAQDLLSKEGAIRAATDVEVHFIGQLQSNKVRLLAGLVSVWSTIDRVSVMQEVAKRVPAATILLQVNATGESQKGGCAPSEVPDLLDRADDLGLTVRGLMTVGPTGEPPEAARTAFECVRRLVDEHELDVCSMGMSADLDVAVECGSTEVRVGTALFGSRPPR